MEMEMESEKKQVITLINTLPDDISIEEIMEDLYVKQCILRAQKEISEGKFLTEEQFKEKYKKWLI